MQSLQGSDPSSVRCSPKAANSIERASWPTGQIIGFREEQRSAYSIPPVSTAEPGEQE